MLTMAQKAAHLHDTNGSGSKVVTKSAESNGNGRGVCQHP